MSVAFRRESDEEHLEPKFERPIAPGPNLVTDAGLVLLGEAVTHAEAAVASASDDATREAARRDLRYWQTRLTTARIAPAPTEGEIGIGSRVRLRLDGAERTVEIVGGDEADPDRGLIGYAAPLARALIGAGEGDVLPFGPRVDAIEILAVEERN
jgi:transcription elongation GreA/GreB family factor